MRNLGLLFLLVSLLSELVFSDELQLELQRDTLQGPVLGFHSSENTLSWHGIPYAKAPIGDLRWRAPQAPETRKQILIANDNTATCPQRAGPLLNLNIFKWNSVVGNEDCLYLNITAPNDLEPGEHLPVMFWIHGGGNSIGSKGNRAYTGENLSSKGRVILVSVNYRLGPLGWFYHPALNELAQSPEDQSGNYGTLDLIQALQWTRANIHHFGGQADNVTVFGESAGGTNTFSLLVSPLAKGLFHRAIVQSGGIRLASKAFASKTREQQGHPYSSKEVVSELLLESALEKNRGKTKNEAHALQDSMDPQKLRDFLYSLSPEQLITRYPGRAAGMLDWPGMLADGHVLPNKAVDELFTNKDGFNNMPIMLGTNRDENKVFMALNPELVGFGFRIKDKQKYNRMASYLARNWKISGVDKHARTLATLQSEVYAYRFDWDELPKLAWIDLSTLIGAGHGLEIPFVFGSFKSDFYIDLLFGTSTKEERQSLSKTMMGYWTNFAYSGSPNTGPTKHLPEWKAWNPQSDNNKFLVLDSPPQGMRMSGEELFSEQLKQALAQDSIITSQQERCALFRQMFVARDLSQLNQEEYLGFAGGCERKALFQ